MKTFLLCCLVCLASPAPQFWGPVQGLGIGDFGSQVIGTLGSQGQQTIDYAGQKATAGVNYLGSNLQATTTFGANTATNSLNLATLPFRPFWG